MLITHIGAPRLLMLGVLAILFDFLDTANLVCLNSGEPTFCSSSGLFSHIDQFDLTFCSPTLAPLFSWHPHFDSFNSDHFPILLDSSFSYPCTSIPKWNLSAADWDRFRSDLHLPTQFESPDESCQSTSDALLSAATHSVPLSTPRRRVAFWWTRACTEAWRKKNVALTRYRHHRGDVSAWINFKKAQASFRLTVRQAKQSSCSQFVSGLFSSCTSSQVWKRVRLLRASVKRRPFVLLENGTHLSAPPAVAELLAETFATKSDGTSGDQQFMAHKVQSISELSLALSSSSSRALGIDRIPYSFLHQLSHPQCLTLLRFFNYIFQNGYPSQWHVGVISISPIFKPSLTTTDKYSYRPITLTDCLSKILGKMVTRRLQAFLEQQAFYCPTQSGFRAGHSTFDGLSRLEFDARQAILMGRYCVAVFLDIARAFDTLWHHGLLMKLHSLGLSGNLARILQGFLSFR